MSKSFKDSIKKKVVAIVQARMGSTRLPGKVLMDLGGKPILWHVVNRLKLCRLIQEIVVATSTQCSDDLIETFCKENGILVFRGSEEDVLDRYYQAARTYQADFIVRITADCPLIDPQLVDAVIQKHLVSNGDYTSNSHAVKRLYPRGFDTEIFSYTALVRANQEAIKPDEREHVTPYFYRHPEFFRLVDEQRDHLLYRPDIRICVDTQDDLTLLRRIFLELKGTTMSAADIVKLFDRIPALLQINAAVHQKTV